MLIPQGRQGFERLRKLSARGGRGGGGWMGERKKLFNCCKKTTVN